jgi:hypothetical protein
MKTKLGGTTEDKVIIFVLIALFVVSVAIPILEWWRTPFKVTPSLFAPVVLLALYLLARLVGGVPEIRKDVRYLREAAASNVRVQQMSNVKEFHDNLRLAVERANSTLDLTHIRETPPRDFGESAVQFYDGLQKWCRVEGRSIRRIICVRNASMYVWAKQLAEETRDLPQFEVRVIDWSTKAPAMNMAIVDGKAVYLALTGVSLERTKGLGIEDDTTAQYFQNYYDNLWSTGKPLPAWLEQNTWEGG